jgi:hypothetical protein
MLLNSEPDLAEYDEPIAIPVFGRGRTSFALVGAGIHEGTIGDSCRFVCGDCSCQVKEQNPGRDLLMAVDWDGRVTGSAMPEPELPALTGIGALAGDGPRGSPEAAKASGAADGSSFDRPAEQQGGAASTNESGAVEPNALAQSHVREGEPFESGGDMAAAQGGDRHASGFEKWLLAGVVLSAAVVLLVLAALTRWLTPTV